MNPVDTVHIRFSEHGLTILNILIGLILFGIALDLKKEDFLLLLKNKHHLPQKQDGIEALKIKRLKTKLLHGVQSLHTQFFQDFQIMKW